MARLAFLLLLIVPALLSAPPEGWAQAEPSMGPGGAVGALAEPALAFTRVNGSGRLMAGGSLGLQMGPSLQIGGAGFVLIRSVDLGPAGPAGDTMLQFGYGGLVISMGSLLPDGGPRWSGGLLLGAAAASVQSPALGTDLGSANMFVLEPRLDVQASLFSSFAIGLRGSYRFLSSASGLPGLSRNDLHGPAGSLFLRFARLP